MTLRNVLYTITFLPDKTPLWCAAMIIVLVVVVVVLLASLLKAQRTIRQLEARNKGEALPPANSSAQHMTEAKQATKQTEQEGQTTQAEQERQTIPAGQTTPAAVDEMPTARSQDDIFVDQLKEAIIQHMDNPNLKMEDLGEAMGLSRVQLYRRVKNATQRGLYIQNGQKVLR